MSENIKTLEAEGFDTAINESPKPLLVDFWAPWCGPCKSIAPIIEDLADEMGEQIQFCKVNVDNNNEIAGRYNIRSIPTLLLFKNGDVVDQVVGLESKDKLKNKLSALL